MRARTSKGPAPNANGAAETTHGAAGYGAPPGVSRAIRRGLGTARGASGARPQSFGRRGGAGGGRGMCGGVGVSVDFSQVML